MLSRYVLAVVAVLLSWNVSFSQNVTLDVRLDSTTIVVGEQVRLRVSVKCPAGSAVVFPEYPDGYPVEGLEMLEASKIDTLPTADGRQWELTRSYLLTAFDSAAYLVPRLEIEVNNRKCQYDREIKLQVNSIPVDMEHPDNIRPFRPPVAAAFRWTASLLLWCASLWGLWVLVGLILVRLSNNKPLTRKIKVVPPLPPHRNAMAAIERLRAEEHKTGEAQKDYFMKLSDVLRTYLFERFGFNAKEMTTREIIATLRKSTEPLAIEELRSVLDIADLVKFARYEVPLPESDRAIFQAVNYVLATQEEVNEDALPKEKIIVIEDKVQIRVRRFLKASALLLMLVALGVFVYIAYMLWLNFP